MPRKSMKLSVEATKMFLTKVEEIKTEMNIESVDESQLLSKIVENIQSGDIKKHIMSCTDGMSIIMKVLKDRVKGKTAADISKDDIEAIKDAIGIDQLSRKSPRKKIHHNAPEITQ